MFLSKSRVMAQKSKRLIKRVVHPVIVVSDMEHALGFYRDLLGLQVIDDYVHDPRLIAELTGYLNPDVRAVVLRTEGGSELELAEFRNPRGVNRVDRGFADSGLYSVTFEVSSIESLVHDLRKAGIRFSTPDISTATRAGRSPVKVTYCYDFDGVLITLVQPIDSPNQSQEGIN